MLEMLQLFSLKVADLTNEGSSNELVKMNCSKKKDAEANSVGGGLGQLSHYSKCLSYDAR